MAADFRFDLGALMSHFAAINCPDNSACPMEDARQTIAVASDDIVKRIVESLDPECIILSGSHAYGDNNFPTQSVSG